MSSYRFSFKYAKVKVANIGAILVPIAVPIGTKMAPMYGKVFKDL